MIGKNINYLLTESEVFMGISQTETSILTERQRARYSKAEVWDFPVLTDQAFGVNKLFIIRLSA